MLGQKVLAGSEGTNSVQKEPRPYTKKQCAQIHGGTNFGNWDIDSKARMASSVVSPRSLRERSLCD